MVGQHAALPGVTLVLPPNVRHWFGATGTVPLETYGVHAAAHRVVVFDPGGKTVMTFGRRGDQDPSAPPSLAPRASPFSAQARNRST